MVRLGFLTGAEELCSLYTAAGNERIALGRTIVKHTLAWERPGGKEGGRENTAGSTSGKTCMTADNASSKVTFYKQATRTK
jgi:hypothetical protein